MQLIEFNRALFKFYKKFNVVRVVLSLIYAIEQVSELKCVFFKFCRNFIEKQFNNKFVLAVNFVYLKCVFRGYLNR